MRVKNRSAILSLAGLISVVAAIPVQADEQTPDTTQAAQPQLLAQADPNAAAPSAAVQPASPPPAPKDQAASETLGGVVVTAQKREQKLQDVPIAVTAIGAKELESRGIQDIADLSALAPGLQVEKSPANGSIAQVAIRGNVQINPAIYWDPAVGIYLDGVFLGKAQGSVFDVVDLSRVEVLRGPQGTLYGRNTIGGAINLVTPKPSGELGGSISVGGGSFGGNLEKVALDLPKFSIVSLSAGFINDRRDGWVTATPGSSVDKLNNRGNTGMRFAANFDLGPHFQADYRFDHNDIDQNGEFGQLDSINPAYAPAPTLPLGAMLSPYASKQRQDSASVDAPYFEHVHTQGHSLTLSWMPNADNVIKSITAYRHLDSRDSADYDGTPLAVAATQRLTAYHQLSQELQWNGHLDRWTYVGGLYYFHDDGYTNNPQTFFFGSTNYDSQYGTRSDAWAPYGQVDFRATDKLTLTAGVRYTEEIKALDRIFGTCTTPANTSCTYTIPAGTHAVGRFEAFTPSFTAAYRLNPNLNTYIRYAQGFKSGGFNGETDDPSEVHTPFQPEKQITIEAGAKSSFFDKRAELNAAIFNNNIRNLQESIFTGQGAAASIIRNAGQATVRGVELEGAVTPLRGTRLSANWAYLDAHYNSFNDNCDPTTGQCTQVKDNRAFIHTPRNTFNVVLDSKFLRTDWGTMQFLADYAYTAGFFLYPYQLSTNTNAPGYDNTKQFADNTHVKGYGLLNLRLALTQIPVGKSMYGEVALWGRNVTNTAVAVNKIDFGPGFGSLTDAWYNDPVTLGVTGSLHF